MTEKLPHGWEAWQAAKTYDEKRGWHWQIIGEAPGFSGPVVIGLLIFPGAPRNQVALHEANTARFEWYTPATTQYDAMLVALEALMEHIPPCDCASQGRDLCVCCQGQDAIAAAKGEVR